MRLACWLLASAPFGFQDDEGFHANSDRTDPEAPPDPIVDRAW